MSITDIEQHRGSFESFARTRWTSYQVGERLANGYLCTDLNDAWESWLAAKRETSVKPICQVVNNVRDSDGNYINAHVITLGDFDLEHIQHGTRLYRGPPASPLPMPEGRITAIYHDLAIKAQACGKEPSTIEFARAIEAEVAARSRAEGGDTQPSEVSN